MSFESIIAFIAIAVISSLFNKAKDQSTAKRNETPKKDVPHGTEALPKTTVPRNSKAPQKKSSSTLEDILRELQSSIRGAFEEYETKPRGAAKDISNAETVDKEKKKEKQSKDKLAVAEPMTAIATGSRNSNEPSLITSGGIGKKKNTKLKLDRQGVVQGIIMSEILGKPKSLRDREIR